MAGVDTAGTEWARRILPKKHALAAAVLGWVLFLHLCGLSLFTRGFLLTRLALDNKTVCTGPSACTLPPTHKRAVLLIIDALRFDFVSPNPPLPISEFHHNILTLPYQLTASQPQNSFLFHAYADPPTATLQRIKGLTTGSLPTFVDIGSSFSGTEITEDSIISQVRSAGKKVAFMGDDTWMSVFPTSFEHNMSFPYDSFNVEDLHSVDEGVIRHLFPLLNNKNAGWDLLIGHFLGVDHVGHRLGPEHPTMRAKLKQMDQMLRNVVSSLDHETLLIVLGDHGMDSKGDHGGDGDLETASALWVYSKSLPLSESLTPPSSISNTLLTNATFPGAPISHRSVQQIDIVPTLSLLLGLPIPFNNLGSIIPELFLRSTSALKSKSSPLFDILDAATSINTKQIMSYLDAYRSSPSGSELDFGWNALQNSFSETSSLEKHFAFTRLALSQCRSMWAQFNGPLMIVGLVVLALSLPALIVVYSALASKRGQWDDIGNAVFLLGWGGAAGGALLGLLAAVAAKTLKIESDIFTVSSLDIVTLSSALASELAVLLPNLRSTTRTLRRSFTIASVPNTLIPIFISVLHSVAFTSNSFTMWEDRMVLFMLITLLLPIVITSFSSPSSHLRYRILALSGIAAVCVRLISLSTVCREEQHPYCNVTFYSSSTRPVSPILFLFLIFPTAFFLPTVVRRFLAIAKSDQATAPLFIEWIWRTALIGGSLYWVMEWVESVFGQGSDDNSFVNNTPGSLMWVVIGRLVRTLVARTVIGGILVGGYAIWWYSPLNIQLRPEDDGVFDPSATPASKKRVVVIGFANAYGSSYLIFILPFFAALWAVTQLTGQIVLALTFVTILCFVEIVDSQKDSRALSHSFESSGSSPESVLEGTPPAQSTVARSPSFAEPAFFALLSHLAFFSTGHQAVLSSIQWKTAFVGFPVLIYPFSPALVSLNTFGPLILPALSLPLLATWAVSPVQRGKVLVLSDSMRLVLGTMIYWTALLIGSAGSVAVLRRHLMVWKVFAPRFMLGGVSLILVDLTLMVGVLIGGARGAAKIKKLFATEV